MAEVSTKEVLSGYFNSLNGNATAKLRNAIDRKELYEYEEQIGKELLDMDVDDLFGLMKYLVNSSAGNAEYRTAISSYDTYASVFRGVFNYYIDIAKVKIKNPFYDPRMRRSNAMRELMKGQETLTWADVEEIIRKIHRDYPKGRATYYECLIRLFYEGVYSCDELVNIKKEILSLGHRQLYCLGGHLIFLLKLLSCLSKLIAWKSWRLIMDIL